MYSYPDFRQFGAYHLDYLEEFYPSFSQFIEFCTFTIAQTTT